LPVLATSSVTVILLGLVVAVEFGALGAQAPIDDLGLIDYIALVIDRSEAWFVLQGTVNIYDISTVSTGQVVVVVARSSLVESR